MKEIITFILITITVIFIVITVIFIVLSISFVINKNTPIYSCDNYANYEQKNLPARCIKYFSQ